MGCFYAAKARAAHERGYVAVIDVDIWATPSAGMWNQREGGRVPLIPIVAVQEKDLEAGVADGWSRADLVPSINPWTVESQTLLFTLMWRVALPLAWAYVLWFIGQYLRAAQPLSKTAGTFVVLLEFLCAVIRSVGAWAHAPSTA